MAPSPWILCLVLATCVPLSHSAGWFDWKLKTEDMSVDEMQTTSADSRRIRNKERTAAAPSPDHAVVTIAPLITTTTTADGIATEDFEAAFQGKTGV